MATLSRWDPFRDLMSIQGELNRLFGRTYAGDGGTNVGAWAPAMDIYETQEQFVVHVELPGVEPDSVDVSVEDSILTLRGERSFYNEVNEDSFHRVERRYGAFSRSFSLPQTVDSNRVSAEYKNGVLTVRLPLREEAKPRSIKVDVAA